MYRNRSAWQAHMERNEFDDVPKGTRPSFDWAKPCAGSLESKEGFHRAARSQLRKLADELGLEKGSYEIRSNRGGNAVSGEIVLHHDHVYVQVSQPVSGPRDGYRSGVLIRTCKGRKDYAGGDNDFAPLAALDQIGKLARRIRAIVPEFQAPDTDYEAPAPAFR